MNVRHLARKVGIGATATVGGLLLFAGAAGASTGTVAPIGTVTAGTPFSSGQTVKVTAPAGSGLPTGSNVTLVECAAPNGVLPTLPSQCDPGDTQSGDSINPAANGSFTYSQYQLYILPDPAFGPSAIVCGNTAATECVVGMFDSYDDFTQPHIFSQPFLISASAGDSGSSPGDGTPELPLAIGLPLAAAGLFAGGLAIRRRRSRRSMAA